MIQKAYFKKQQIRDKRPRVSQETRLLGVTQAWLSHDSAVTQPWLRLQIAGRKAMAEPPLEIKHLLNYIKVTSLQYIWFFKKQQEI